MEKSFDYSNIVMTPPEFSSVRYSLVKEGKKPVIVLGFNPSTASSSQSDRTMDSVVRIANFNGYDGFIMVNLYPLRSTSPKALPVEQDEELNKRNIEHIKSLLQKFPDADVLLAYGDLVNLYSYTKQIANKIINLLLKYERNILCISKLKSGNPKHPLYAKSTTKLIPYI